MRSNRSLTASGAQKKVKQWSDWIKEPQFYIFAFVYMFARIALNVTATMMPLYLTSVSGFVQQPGKGIPYQIALVLLCSYTFSLLYSLYGQVFLTKRFINRLIPLALSILVTGVGSIPYAFLTTNPAVLWLIYPLAAIQGVGIAMMLNTSTSLISDVINQDAESAAFVYGIYSFLDKFANGFLLFWLVAQYSENERALRIIISVIPMSAAVGTALLTWLGTSLFADKMSDVRKGSYNVEPKRSMQVAPV